MSFIKSKLSFITVIALSLTITCFSFFHYRSGNNIKNIITWDVFGYYMYLPATFIYDDLLLEKKTWVDQIKKEYQPSSTLYQIIKGEGDKWLVIYTMGLAILYAPFFFIAHAIAEPLGFAADGYSNPYQWAILCCGLFYTIIGLFVLRKVLLNFFNEVITSFILSIIVIGTNYFQLTAFEGTISHNFMFTMNTIILLLTIRWHKTKQLNHLLLLALCIGFSTMSRPIELIWLLIPMLWGIYNYSSLREKVKILLKYKKQLMLFVIIFCLGGIAQLFYWKATTGKFIFYTYELGFTFSKPHLIAILFSYKKGWLLYTPILTFALIGFIFLFKYNKSIFIAVFSTFIIVLYTFSSYESWWFATSFSSRAMMDTYPLLTIPLGYFIYFISQQKRNIKIIFTTVFILLIALNIFQLWQYNNGIIDQERMTKDYYWKVFGKTFTTEDYKDLLEVERSTETVEYLRKDYKFNKKILAFYDFENKSSEVDTNHITLELAHSGKNSFMLDSNLIYSPGISMKYDDLTKKEYAWVRASAYVYPKYNMKENPASLVITFENNGKSYKYRALDLDTLNLKIDAWNKISMDYMTPIIKSTNDLLKVYVWHRGKKEIYLDDFSIEAFESKK